MYQHIQETLHAKRDEIIALAKRYGAKNIRVFGSRVRGDHTSRSDIDFLLELEPGRSLLDHVALWQDLEELLDCKVDVVTEKSLHPALKNKILKEAIPL